MTPFSELLKVLTHPFDKTAGNEDYAVPAPIIDRPYRTFCGT
jgi:uncharacterized protein YdiU (UPF0061 family)